MNDGEKQWRTYEEVAQYLLNEFATHFGLGLVEGKQIIPGASGAKWEIEAKGVAASGEGFVIVECRRYTTSKIDQERVGGLAFRIIDTKASGGILVSPFDLQSGAKKVAAHSNIQHVILDPASTTTEYLMSFLKDVFIGFSDKINLKDSVTIELIRDGKVIDKRHCE
jgi:hypothetical protein